MAELQVTFNNKQWYVIADDSTSATEGTVTLLAKESIEKSKFSTDRNNHYSISTVKSDFDKMTVEGDFARVADVIKPVELITKRFIRKKHFKWRSKK